MNNKKIHKEDEKWVTDYNQEHPPRFRPIWQLCPKCGGCGHIPNVNSMGQQISSALTKQCDVCFGKMIIATPRAL